MFNVLTVYDIKTIPKGEEITFFYRPTGSFFEKISFCILAVFSKKYDAVLVEATHLSTIIALLRCIFPRRVKLFVNSPFFDFPPKTVKKRLIFKLLDSAIYRYLVVGSDEIEAYQKYWHIKKEKLLHHPFKVNSGGLLDTLEVKDGDFIHTGGDSLRDYKCLFDAIRGACIRTEVFTSNTYDSEVVPLEVTLLRRSKTVEEFYRSMAESMVCVFPTEPGRLRVAAQSCYLCAMYLRKIVIVSDGPGVNDFIINGQNGFVVPPGDSAALREKILYVKKHYKELAPMRQAAYESVREHTHDNYMQRMFNYIVDAL